MNISLGVLLVLAGMAEATTVVPAIESAPEKDSYVRQHDEYLAVAAEIDSLVNSGNLRAAEAAVARYEPKFAHRWSVGRFGYGARMEIGQAYLKRGEAKEALRLFKSAKPGGGCGNCMASQHVQRNIRVARIHESRLNFPAAFWSYLAALPATTLGGGLFSVVFGLAKSGAVCSAPIFALAYFIRRRMRRSTGQPGAAPNGGSADADR